MKIDLLIEKMWTHAEIEYISSHAEQYYYESN